METMADRRVTVHFDNSKNSDYNYDDDDEFNTVTFRRKKRHSLDNIYIHGSLENIRSSSPNTSGKNDSGEKPEKPQKEKKKKDVSISRQKKFYRHFQQVSSNEKVINYFSCALVSDILLQGHLYITETYFAFYSNVFGYVTKLLIPIASVASISKEKTAKMFPNAIGVTTFDDRHVFGSFISRETAFQLMSCTWEKQKSIVERDEIDSNVPAVPEIQISESLDDESSCSISGNEGILQYSKDSQTPSPPPLTDKANESPFKPNPRTSSTPTETSTLNTSSSKANIDVTPSPTSTMPTTTTASPIKVSKSSVPPLNANIRSRSVSASRKHSTIIENPIIAHHPSTKVQNEFNLLYVGVGLAIALAVISVLLLLKINNIQSKPNFYYHDLHKHENRDVEVYAEWLKWQSEMQTKSIDEAESILNTNLKEVVKVRKSLEALQNLLQDSFMKFPPLNGDARNEKQEF